MVCPNEHEEIQSIINQRGVRRVVGKAAGAGRREEESEEREGKERINEVAMAPRKPIVEIEKEHKTTFYENFEI